MFQKKTVSSILAGFHKTITDLNGLSESKNSEIEHIDDTITYLSEQRGEAVKERDHALTVSAKLSSLLSEIPAGGDGESFMVVEGGREARK